MFKEEGLPLSVILLLDVDDTEEEEDEGNEEGEKEDVENDVDDHEEEANSSWFANC